METAKFLFDLQNLDQEVLTRGEHLFAIKERLADSSDVDVIKSKLEELDPILLKQAASRDRVGLLIKALDQKLDEMEQKLYGGSINSPRELSALQDEEAMLQKQKSIEEEKLIELMVSTEDLQSERDGAAKNLQLLEQKRKIEHPLLLERQNCIEEQLEDMKEKRRGITDILDPGPLSLYETLMASRQGQAIAQVQRGLCQGCRIALPISELSRARDSQMVVQCSSCRRILYLT